MSQRIRPSFIPVAIFFAVLLIFLPVSADNLTVTVTTVAPAVTNITTAPTAAVTNTTVVPPVTTVLPAVTNVTTAETTIAATQTTNATIPTTTAPTPVVTTVVTTANATPPAGTAGTTGDVNVYSSPTGASILIDGIYSGTTPSIVKNVPAGNHILRLSLSGYHDYEGSIYVVSGEGNQGYGTLQPISIMTSASTPAPTAIAVIVPVTPLPEQTQDPGLFGNSSVIVAIIGAIGVLVAAGATVFTHVKPPKKE
jgi:hypothetical protein